LIVAFALAAGGRARAADAKAACIEAHARAQELRIGGRWRKAQEELRACAQSSCPAPVVEDCARWHGELKRQMPSVVLAANGPDGGDTLDVRLIVDGAPLAERLPTTAVELDPGEHVVRLEHSGWRPVEQRVVVREGEKERRLTLHFAAQRMESAASERSSRSALPIVLLGAGLAATGVGVTFGVLGRGRETELADSPCGQAGRCAPSDVDVVRRDYWIAGIAGGIGLAAVGIGIWLLVARPADASHAALSRSVARVSSR
jgi:hypothetical protein